ncbi:hypothetical protein LMH73_020165 [Vibrio splendidus]|nr:hypothetical protein [Vibrio splendidus]MCC4880482.1 hypothetical protein [Vibrio splendidus]
MSYYTTYAKLNLKADFRGIQIDQMRFATEPNDKELLLCFECDPCFNQMLEILGLTIDELPVLNIQYYRKEYMLNYYSDVTEDVPVSDAQEMEYDLNAKNHIVTKALSVIPFQEVFSDGACEVWTNWLGGKDCRYGDFTTMFFAKDAKDHLNHQSGFSSDSLKFHLESTLRFAGEHPDGQAIVFAGIY